MILDSFCGRQRRIEANTDYDNSHARVQLSRSFVSVQYHSQFPSLQTNIYAVWELFGDVGEKRNLSETKIEKIIIILYFEQL